MNNMQLYLSTGIPTLTVVLASLSNRANINRLADRLDRMGEVSNIRIDGQGASLRAGLIALRNDHHEENLALTGYMVPLRESMAKLQSQN